MLRSCCLCRVAIRSGRWCMGTRRLQNPMTNISVTDAIDRRWNGRIRTQ